MVQRKVIDSIVNINGKIFFWSKDPGSLLYLTHDVSDHYVFFHHYNYLWMISISWDLLQAGECFYQGSTEILSE